MGNTGALDYMAELKALPELDAQRAIDAVGGAEELYAKVLDKVIRLLPSHIGQMDVHIAEFGDLGAFAVKAHGLKTSLRQIGAFAAARLAEALEHAAKEGDKQYCAAHYGAFRDEAMRLHSLLSKAPQGLGQDSRDASESDRKRLFAALSQARELAAEFDTLAAAKALAPFAGLRFGPSVDPLLCQAVEALDLFKPGEAAAAMETLLSKGKDVAL